MKMTPEEKFQYLLIATIVVLVLGVFYLYYYEPFSTIAITMEPKPWPLSNAYHTSGAYIRKAGIDSASNRGARTSGFIDGSRDRDFDGYYLQ